jgi:hypothetical protein
MQVFNAIVKYEAREPRDGGFGLSSNAVFTLAQPGPDGKNEVKIYRKTDHKEYGWLSSLKKGDTVQLAYQTGSGGDGYYAPVIAGDLPTVQQGYPTQAQPVNASANGQGVTSQVVWYPWSDNERALVDEMVKQQADMLVMCYQHIKTVLNGEADDETVRTMAISAFIEVNRKLKPGMVMGKTPGDSSSDKRGVTSPVEQASRYPEWGELLLKVGDAVKVKGKKDVKPGTVKGFNGELVTVAIDGTDYDLSPDKLTRVASE